jgi:hypothetical protein
MIPKVQEIKEKTDFTKIKNFHAARHWWLTPVILATQEAEIRKIWFEPAQANSS